MCVWGGGGGDYLRGGSDANYLKVLLDTLIGEDRRQGGIGGN